MVTSTSAKQASLRNTMGQRARVTPPPVVAHSARRVSPALVLGLVIITAVVLMAVLAPFIAPYDMAKIAPADRLQAPSSEHLMGTDAFGRDLLSRVIYGARFSLTVAALAVSIGALPGITLGCLAGMYPGLLENIVSRIMDAWMALPAILLAVVIAAAFGRSALVIAVALGMAGIPTYYRQTRAEVLRVRSELYVEAARSVGSQEWYIIYRHVLPNVLPTLLVLLSLRIAGMLLAASALGFIGLGAQPPEPEWGTLMAEGREHYHRAWWLVVFPGSAIALTVFGFNTLGDGLRDMLDIVSSKTL